MPARSAKLPPRENPATPTAFAGNILTISPRAVTTSSMRQEWKRASLRPWLSPWSRKFRRKTSQPSSSRRLPVCNTYVESTLPSQPWNRIARPRDSRPVRWAVKRPLNRSPRPTSISTSCAFSCTWCARLGSRRRRMPLDESMVWMWPLRSGHGGRKSEPCGRLMPGYRYPGPARCVRARPPPCGDVRRPRPEPARGNALPHRAAARPASAGNCP